MTLDVSQKIEAIRKELGSQLVILAHHYQNDAVVAHADIVGDSLELARKMQRITARNIVFCGVYFMAETASLLAAPGQKVFLPDLNADCDMARMAPGPMVGKALASLNQGLRKVIPLTYVNSSLAVKAVVGEYGGAVCTSANAKEMLEWSLAQKDAVLFLPDKYLGANMGDAVGIAPEDRCILQMNVDGRIMNPAEANSARLLLWPGYCPVHEEFTLAQMKKMRQKYPGAKVIVHPECPPAVVRAADAAGSTSFLIKYVTEAPVGSTVIVGTEINLVERLARQHVRRVTVLPLAVSSCKDMAYTTEENLLALLQNISCGKDMNRIEVDPAMRAPARLAIERMLNH